uniref:Fructose-bisphosphate aldolase n=1 Tax=Dicyema acuticephalum TaxID=49299 RepID=A4PCF1_DICAC|nr:fructose-bisphosphate aldolase [Dicyema acuticephalum]BAF51686.1 fructose-bisphosphate aldolase [Dicyema acuticephalum]
MNSFLTESQQKELSEIANKLTKVGRGILAADESTGTIGKRFSAINCTNNEQNRRLYRQMLFSSGKVLSNYISGVIMYDETFWQKSDEGVSFPEVLRGNGILTGIKVDLGVVSINELETTTQGFDNLDKRCAEYKKAGADFAKWRCVLTITDQTPSELAIVTNSNVLAWYAKICQRNGIVPIVEPEVLCDGTHSLERCEYVTTKVLAAVYKALNDQDVFLEGTLLKPNMVTSGMQANPQSSFSDNATATLRTLRRTVPSAVPGIVFLSGGFSESDSTNILNEINKQANTDRRMYPWSLSFSYGRALQHSVIRTWNGDCANNNLAVAQLIKRANACSDAAQGVHSGTDDASANESLFVAKHVY